MKEVSLFTYTDRCGLRKCWAFYEKNGVYHRKSGPAIIQFRVEDELKKQEVWIQHGIIFRENDLPNIIEYYDDGRTPYTERWCCDTYSDLFQKYTNRKNNKPPYITYGYYKKNIYMRFFKHNSGVNKYNFFIPYSIQKFDGNEPYFYTWAHIVFRNLLLDEKQHRYDEINYWMYENNIVLSEHNNFEIPDEYKAEFKLRFG